MRLCVLTLPRIFLSTPSVRRATEVQATTAQHTTISIHALREEGDQSHFLGFGRINYFYPRPP